MTEYKEYGGGDVVTLITRVGNQVTTLHLDMRGFPITTWTTTVETPQKASEWFKKLCSACEWMGLREHKAPLYQPIE